MLVCVNVWRPGSPLTIAGMAEQATSREERLAAAPGSIKRARRLAKGKDPALSRRCQLCVRAPTSPCGRINVQASFMSTRRKIITLSKVFHVFQSECGGAHAALRIPAKGFPFTGCTPRCDAAWTGTARGGANGNNATWDDDATWDATARCVSASEFATGSANSAVAHAAISRSTGHSTAAIECNRLRKLLRAQGTRCANCVGNARVCSAAMLQGVPSRGRVFAGIRQIVPKRKSMHSLWTPECCLPGDWTATAEKEDLS